MGGEHTTTLYDSTDYDGSSPHGWGTHLIREKRMAGYRFIPTWVGNTVVVQVIPWDQSVHPHMGGEHLTRFSNHHRTFGSSPHGWGTLDIPYDINSITRFIPTWVGNTFDISFPVSGDTVHPHMGGEHIVHVNTAHIFSGSSPHGWGTLIEISCPVR